MLRVCLTFLAILVVAVIITAINDELAVPIPDCQPEAEQSDYQIEHAGERRAFIILVDSLRYRNAVDPKMMPNLVELQERSAYGRVEASRDAVTKPAVAAAFIGSDSFRALGFVDNFLAGAAHERSLFTELARSGLETLVYTDRSFDQFGDSVTVRESRLHDKTAALTQSFLDDDGVVRNLTVAREALAAFVNREYDVVIMHLLATDWVAHVRRPGAERYDRAFFLVDEFIAEAAAAVDEREILMVMGDHGHNEAGVHAPGMVIPTFGLYRGAAYRPGTDFAPADMVVHRYLLGFGLGVGLPCGYQGRAHSEALAPLGPLSDTYAAGPKSAGQAPTSLWAWLLVAVVAGLFGSLVPALATVGLRRRLIGIVLVGGAGGLFSCGWGSLQIYLRPWIHASYHPHEVYWLVAMALGLAAGLRWGARRTAWVFLAVFCLLLPATVYPYGAMATMAPVWLVWLALVLIAWARRRPPFSETEPRVWWRRIMGVGVLVLAFSFVQMCALPVAVKHEFLTWSAFIPQISPRWSTAWPRYAWWALLIIFYHPRPTRSFGTERRAWASEMLWQLVPAIIAATLIYRLQLAGGFAKNPATVAIVAALIVALLILRRRQDDRLDATKEIVWVAIVYLAFLYTVRLPWIAYWHFDCLLAGVVLSARAVSWIAEPERSSHRLLILTLGTIAAGWCTLAYGVNRLEWEVLYDWFDPITVEDRVGWFLPFIVGKCGLSVWLVRILIERVLPAPRWRDELRALSLVAISITVLLGLGLGMARLEPGGKSYLECVIQIAVILVIATGLLWPVSPRPSPIFCTKKRGHAET